MKEASATFRGYCCGSARGRTGKCERAAHSTPSDERRWRAVFPPLATVLVDRRPMYLVMRYAGLAVVSRPLRARDPSMRLALIFENHHQHSIWAGEKHRFVLGSESIQVLLKSIRIRGMDHLVARFCCCRLRAHEASLCRGQGCKQTALRWRSDPSRSGASQFRPTQSLEGADGGWYQIPF